jgi:hypothetical protein
MVVRSALCTAWPIGFIWALVALNWLVHVIFRPSAWPVPLLLLGHALLALQVLSFLQCAHTHPGRPTAEWQRGAAAGEEECSVHVDSGTYVPLRAHYTRRGTGEVILHFDHHCWWIARPIGFR